MKINSRERAQMVVKTLTCDRSCNFRKMRRLEMEGLVEIFAVAIEGNERNGKATNKVLPTAIIGSRFALISEEDYPRSQIAADSCLYEKILSVLGKGNREDALHLEAHIRDGRDAFVTEDGDDILSQKEVLRDQFGVTVLHSNEVRSWLKSSS